MSRKAELSGVIAADWHELFHNWWQLALAGIILASSVLGAIFLIITVIQNLHSRHKAHKSNAKPILPSTNRYLKDLRTKLDRYQFERDEAKPTSFGVFLGEFDNPPTQPQIQLLSTWELLIVDPLKFGVIRALLSDSYVVPRQCLARLDIGALQSRTLSAAESICNWITTLIDLPANLETQHCVFTGIILSNWGTQISESLLRELVEIIGLLGLSVYLEVSAPEFLADCQLAELKYVTGLVVRNGIISSSGEERDAFQMKEMRPTIKAFVSQACLRSFVVLAWETLEDEVTPSNAVIKRCYTWSRFYSALPWIGTASALTSAELSIIQIEPYGAFDWLKELKVMDFHSKWRLNNTIQLDYSPETSKCIEQLSSILALDSPSINSTFLKPSPPQSLVSAPGSTACSYTLSNDATSVNLSSNNGSTNNISLLNADDLLGWQYDDKQDQPLSTSSNGSSYDYLGCFPLGSSVDKFSFDDVVHSMERLKNMRLLDEVERERLTTLGQKLRAFHEYLNSQGSGLSDWSAAIQDLAQQLSAVTVTIRAHIGLNSGFQVHPESRFWAVYSLEEDMAIDIYLSRDVQDIDSTILHTFLSSRGCPRTECFQAEVALAKWSMTTVENLDISARLFQDVADLSPSEQLLLHQSLTCSSRIESCSLMRTLAMVCEWHLLHLTDFKQLKELGPAYLSGQIPDQDLISRRIKWYSHNGREHPEEALALGTFRDFQICVTQLLRMRNIPRLQSVTEILAKLAESGGFDSRADLIFLSIFCAMRKHAFDEAYLEVTDRNTLFNDQSDQAAAFAELFATGARCEAYFDMTPSAFGKILSDRFRAYHHRPGYEPPIWSDADPATPSAYAAAKIDVDPKMERSSMAAHQRFTFLSVFAIPALLDILLLTTTKRGLYLSGYMSDTELHAATLALMISLLISGAVGTWITAGGSYYLISMAFSAMNIFVVTRLVFGLAFTLLVAFIGFIAVGATDGPVGGAVFFLYLVVLTSYLCLLAALANFQYPGSGFLSGRPVIVSVIPVLFISPVACIWIHGHDIYIYLSVLYAFILLLLLGTRRTLSRWGTWYLEIEKITDQDLRNWFIKARQSGDESSIAHLTDPGVLKLARTAILKQVKAELSRFAKSCKDPFVQKLARSYHATVFLLEWYSTYSGTPLPIHYSSTWNMQTKVALQTLKQLQTGIRLHNAFIHWRQAGDEVGCSILYFIVALLDKWNALLAGGKLVGLADYEGTEGVTFEIRPGQFGSATPPLDKRYATGFALAYYLIGAVFLDYNVTKLHTMTARGQNMLIDDTSSIPEAIANEVRARRWIYWSMLARYLLIHTWSLAVASSLLWIFDSRDGSEPIMIFIAYIGAYTGLLWFQYTKVFSGPRSLKPLLAAVAIGLPLGQVLRKYLPHFGYSDVIALAAATWTAAILSLYYARIKSKSALPQNNAYSKLGSDTAYHSFARPGKDPLLSQNELKIIFGNLTAMRDEEKYRLDPVTPPGLEVKSVLAGAIRNFRLPQDHLQIAIEAFPEAAKLLDSALSAFENGSLTIDCVQMSAMTVTDVKAVSYFCNGHLRIIMGCEMMDTANQQSSISMFCRMTAEIIVHSIGEALLSMSCEDSVLAESLVSISSSGLSPVPQRIISQLKFSHPSSRAAKAIARFCEEQALRSRCLGYDPDIEWESLPREIRSLLIERCLGRHANVTKSQQDWLLFDKTQASINLKTRVARSNFGAFVADSSKYYALGAREEPSKNLCEYSESTLDPLIFLNNVPPIHKISSKIVIRALKTPFSVVYHTLGICLRLIAIAFVAEPELQRELNYVLQSADSSTRYIVLFFVTALWRYTKALQDAVMSIFLLHGSGRQNVKTLWKHIGGTTISLLSNDRISIESAEGTSTAFIHPPSSATNIFKVAQYLGNHSREPADNAKLQQVSDYSASMLLLRREEYNNGTKGNVYQYEYAVSEPKARNRLSKLHMGRSSYAKHRKRFPILRKCIEGKDESEEHHYNHYGLVESGSYILHGSLVRFQCHYRQTSSSEDEILLRAEFVLPHLSCTVSWSVPPITHQEKLDTWIPSSQVMEASFVLGSDVYEARWIYDHKYHPTIITTLNGKPVETPPIIQWDHLGVLKKPTKYSFVNDDIMIAFSSFRSNALLRALGLSSCYNPISTSKARSKLWKAWKNEPGFDGVMARWLDEKLMRKEPRLSEYWKRRDRGQLTQAQQYLDDNIDAIMSSVDLETSISSWCPLAIKKMDLYSFGQGGDANSRTRSKEPDFDNDELQVLAVDSGTWPNEGGGVSACRRDMINNLRSVSWFMIAESANDCEANLILYFIPSGESSGVGIAPHKASQRPAGTESPGAPPSAFRTFCIILIRLVAGLPKHQTEMNVRSLKVIPLWGLDFLTPTHGLFSDRLDSEVEHVPRHATKLDIERNFLPILTALVKGARTTKFSKSDILQTTRALVSLNTYFSETKHWGAVWKSRVVRDTFKDLWISQDLVTPTGSEGWFQTEYPTIAQLDGALELWFRYLFIFSIPIPEKIPPIFQASHHSVSASYGIVCKIKRGCTLQIWDHAISWRETNLYLSSDLCPMAPFVRNALLGLMKITSQLILHHADTILPCADFFNPGWEVEIGTNQGGLEHRNVFKRKIDPVVNGIPDMSAFSPIKNITSELPTVTMLSHVWYAKDIKTAILAADIIVNEWGFKEYRLDIYGAIDKAPSYSTDCFEIIASKSLPRYVVMRGEANPTTVLQKTWVFLNSSISEGLPLALGEAALTGAPVVCTDVGASLRVLTDPDTGACYSAVVAPNDARNLARAQINFLAMLDEWAPYANDPEVSAAPSLSDKPSLAEVEVITKRMYEKVEERKALGMRSREIVQKSFGGERYLREHEQMLWIGKARYNLLHPRPTKSPPIPTQSLNIASNIWGTTVVPSAVERRLPLSSVQTKHLMTNSLQASTLNTPGLRSLFDIGIDGTHATSSKATTVMVPNSARLAPVKQYPKVAQRSKPARVSFMTKNSRHISGRASIGSKILPGDDSFLEDITIALEQV